MFTSVENKIKLTIIKANIAKSIRELAVFSILDKIKKKAGANYTPVDPYCEENWDK